MVDEEEYAIVSKKEFMQLKRELDKLKKNPLEGSEKGADLQDSIDSLNVSLNSMMNLFKEASDQLQLEERDTEMVGKKLDPINEKLDTLIEQNQKIAKGIVAVADMVREKLEEMGEKEEHKESPRPPMGPPPGPVPMGPPGGMMSPPGFGPEEEEPMSPFGAPMPPPAPGSGPGMAPLPPLGSRPEKRKPILGGFMRK